MGPLGLVLTVAVLGPSPSALPASASSWRRSVPIAGAPASSESAATTNSKIKRSPGSTWSLVAWNLSIEQATCLHISASAAKRSDRTGFL